MKIAQSTQKWDRPSVHRKSGRCIWNWVNDCRKFVSGLCFAFASILSNCVSIILNLDISIDCSQFPIFFIISSGSSAYRYGRPSWFHSPRVMSRFHLIPDGRPCITQSARSRPSYGKIVGCEQSSISKVHEKRLYCISKEVRAIVVENKRFPYYIIAVFYSQKIQMPRTIIDG